MGTSNDAKNSLCGLVLTFSVCPPDGNCSGEDSADEKDPQLHNLSRRLLLAQYELFDIELIDFIVQMTNEYAIETNAAGWVPIDRSDICCFLGILMVSGIFGEFLGRCLWCAATASMISHASKQILFGS